MDHDRSFLYRAMLTPEFLFVIPLNENHATDMLHEVFIIMYSQIFLHKNPTGEHERLIRVSCSEYLKSRPDSRDYSYKEECTNCGDRLSVDKVVIEKERNRKCHQFLAGCEQIRSVLEEMITKLPLSQLQLAQFYSLQGRVEYTMYLVTSGDERVWYLGAAISSLSTGTVHAGSLPTDHPIVLSIAYNLASLTNYHGGHKAMAIQIAEKALFSAEEIAFSSESSVTNMNGNDHEERKRLLESLRSALRSWKAHHMQS